MVIGPDVSLPLCARVSLKSQEEEDGDFGMGELSLEDESQEKKAVKGIDTYITHSAVPCSQMQHEMIGSNRLT